ncbi:hypothetical protein C4J81_13655 [Deltaproteobacteria bacterium Smac51]|nr:hypothetical protein C4J81_13655 [Deltaproteobacteria bacterium Smac51]
MRLFGKIAAILCVAIALWAGPLVYADSSGPAAVSEEAAASALKQSIRHLNLQTQMPEGYPVPPDLEPIKLPSFFSLSEKTAKFLLWGAIAVVVAVLLLKLRDNLWSNSRARKLKAEEEAAADDAPHAVTARMDMAQLEAEELARRGNFARAMHVLLLRSVSELRLKLDVSIAASLTSREILARIGLGPKAGAAFADIIGRVEISYFGDYEPGEAEYLACRQSFEILTQSLQSGGRV